MGDDWVLGACGLNCGVCDIYKAGKGDVEKQMETRSDGSRRRGTWTCHRRR